MTRTTSVRSRIVPRLTGLVVGGAALSCAVWSVLPFTHDLLAHARAALVDQYLLPPTAGLGWALALGILAVGLWRAKRIA